MRRASFIILALLTAASSRAGLISAPAADVILRAGDLRRITVDGGSVVGRLRSLQGVNGAPAPGMHKPENFKFGGWNMPERIDASTGYRIARIDLVRTHDAYGPGDIDSRFESAEAPGGGLISAHRDGFVIFPNPDANPGDPRSYNFGPTDELVSSIVKIGAQVMFRLGRSEGADPSPPRDLGKYAAIARHIVMHYNRGWDRGFHYRIRYWEIWNEPDLGKVFWSGTGQQYFELYERLARAVKAVDPAALVGGPAIARPNDDTMYRDAFLEYVRAENLPLDFYSWHWYATDSDDPLDFVRVGKDVRARLDRHGLSGTRSILSEWNYGLMDPMPVPMQRAAFIASATIYMQDAPIDAATLYRADSVFGADGATPDEVGAALIALGRMKSTPQRLKVTGADLDGFAVEAARSADGRLVQVLVSNYQIPAQFLGPRAADDVLHVPPVFDVRLLARRSVTYRDNAGYDLTIDHLPPSRRWAVERCRIGGPADSSAAGAQTPSPGSDSPPRSTEDSEVVRSPNSIHLKSVLPPPGIELITLRAVEGRNGAMRHKSSSMPPPARCAWPDEGKMTK